MNRSRRQRRTGFTLVEILVVVGIVAVLMAIIIPVLVRTRRAGQRTECMNNMRMIGQAMLSYAIENNGELPRIRWDKTQVLGNGAAPPPDAPNPFATTFYNDSSAGLFLLVRTGRLPPKTFICPATEDVADDLGGVQAQERSNFSKNTPDIDGVRTRSYSYSRLYPTAEAAANGFTVKVQQMDTNYVLLADYGIPLCALPQDPAHWTDPGKKGNSLNHNQDGQNVLYTDGRVEWQVTNRCGAQMPRHPTDPDNPNFTGPDNIYKGYGRNFCSPELPQNSADSVLEEAI